MAKNLGMWGTSPSIDEYEHDGNTDYAVAAVRYLTQIALSEQKGKAPPNTFEKIVNTVTIVFDE